MNEDIYKRISETLSAGNSVVLCTVISSTGSAPRHAGTKMLIFENGERMGTVGGGEIEGLVINEAMTSLKTNKTKVLKYSMVDPLRGDPGTCGGTVEILVEPIKPSPRVIIIGGGHVGKALAQLAKYLGFKVAVSDDRVEFCNHEANPSADEFFAVPMKELPDVTDITSSTYLLLTTRGSETDIAGLGSLLKTPAAFIGVIGSRRRWETTRKGLLEQGVSVEDLDRVHSPLGLELNAETPEEIAVSIMAEVIMVRNNGTGISMKA